LHYVYEKDYQKAYDIFQEAHNFHYPAATFQLARYYESGILASVPKDNKMAQKYYRQAALNSYCKAMYRLSMAYLHGEIDCKKSKKESVRWLHRCTWSIDSKEQMVVGEAMYQLSKFYEKGMTTDKEKDQKSAASYLRMAAEKYCVDAQDYLGYCYQHGHLSYPCNMKKAVYWFTQAANGHCIEAKISLCHLYLTGSPPDIPQDDSEALYWIRRAANTTHVNNCTQRFSKAKAQYILGWFFEEGLEGILEKDKKEAIKWYLKANFEGVPDAKSALKHFTQEEIDEVIQEEKQNKASHEEESYCCDHNDMNELNKCNKKHEEESDYSCSEFSDDNISNASGRSNRSLNVKLMNMASSLWNHGNGKKHHYSKSYSNTHDNIKNGEIFTEEKKSEKISENHSSNVKDEEKIIPNKLSESASLSHECQCSSDHIEKIADHNHNIHMEELNRKIHEANKEESHQSKSYGSDDTFNNLNQQKSSNQSSEDLSKDTLVNDDLQHHHDHNVISEKEKQYIAKLNSDLVKSMMITKSDPNSPYITSISAISSNSSQHSEEHVHLNNNIRNMEFIGNESVCSSCSSYSSLLSEECSSSAYCSTCCYSCSSYCPSSKLSHTMNINSITNQINGHLAVQAPSSTASVTSEECSSNNFETMSQDSSISSTNIKAHLHSSQKFAGYDKSQITSSDRMKAYSHYKNTINNRKKQNKEAEFTANEEKVTPITSKKIKRRHSHSGIPRNFLNPLTPLNSESTLVNNNLGLKQRSKSSLNINEQRRKSMADEDALRLHHIKGLSDTESEKSYVCPQTANIFDTFEKREEHHDYGHNNERHQSKPKSVVKSCQHVHHHHHEHSHKHRSISIGHHHHHHHHHNNPHRRSRSHEHPHSGHHNLLKFNLHHSLTITSLPNKHSKSTDSLGSHNSNNKSKEEGQNTNTPEKQNIKIEIENVDNEKKPESNNSKNVIADDTEKKIEIKKETKEVEGKTDNEKEDKLLKEEKEEKYEKNEKNDKNELIISNEQEEKEQTELIPEKIKEEINEDKKVEKEEVILAPEPKEQEKKKEKNEEHHKSIRETLRKSKLFTKSKEHLKIDTSKTKKEDSPKSASPLSENSKHHRIHSFFNNHYTHRLHFYRSHGNLQQDEAKKEDMKQKEIPVEEHHHNFLNKFNVFHFHHHTYKQ